MMTRRNRRVSRTIRTRGAKGYRGRGRDDMFERDSVSAVSNGPVTFELDLGRAWGMSPRTMRTLWEKMAPFINRATAAGVRAHPERWRRERRTGQLVFVGETPKHENINSEPFTRDQKRRGDLVPLDRYVPQRRR